MNATIKTIEWKHSLCPAFHDLGVQVTNPDGYACINLSAMHRASGQPEGMDPWAWGRSAAAVLRELSTYKAVVREAPPGYTGLWRLKDTGDVPLTEHDYVGDCTTVSDEIALLYARHLDGCLPADPWALAVRGDGIGDLKSGVTTVGGIQTSLSVREF